MLCGAYTVHVHTVHEHVHVLTFIFSLGILLWELWSGGKTPYPAFTNPQVLDEVSVYFFI